MHDPAAGATRRCPVQPSTPLGPDQVNVLLLLFSSNMTEFYSNVIARNFCRNSKQIQISTLKIKKSIFP
jgi:hypothetical protein